MQNNYVKFGYINLHASKEDKNKFKDECRNINTEFLAIAYAKSVKNKLMRNILLLLTLLVGSCTGTKLLNERFNYEISHYNLEQIDTLVDIGCGFAHGARFISSNYKNLHFVLEELPRDIWGNDMKVALSKNVKNTPFAPTFGTKSRIVFGTAETIPLQTGQYERVLCRITLHEFSSREKMISELIRILSPTGILLIVERTPIYEGQRDKYCNQLYMSKQQIIRAFSTLKLVDTIQLQPLTDNAFLFKFRK